jgi:hypothetical protein
MKNNCLLFFIKDLQEFADGAEHGLIVFTLGSNSRVSSMPVHIQETFLRVFSRLPQRIIWKWEKDGQSQIPDNVRLVDWLPQQDLLGKFYGLLKLKCNMKLKSSSNFFEKATKTLDYLSHTAV